MLRLSSKQRLHRDVLKRIESGDLSRREGCLLLGLNERQMLGLSSRHASEGNADLATRRQFHLGVTIYPGPTTVAGHFRHRAAPANLPV